MNPENRDNGMNWTVRVMTLGCKVNQVESSAILADLRRAGFYEAGRDAPADVVVINSCTVTAAADRDVRKMVSRAREENAGVLVVLTGCLSAEGRSAQDRADLVTTNRDKARLPERILAKLESREVPTGDENVFFGTGVFDSLSRSRAFLKVQDGCDMACAYCIVPSVRGSGRSRPAAGIIREVLDLYEKGFREIVLTGIHIGRFGIDQNPRDNLVGLLKALLNDTEMPRIRVSSIEPLEVEDDLLTLMADHDRICRHLHIPLQSGDDAVLARMRRPYRRENYIERVRRIARALPDVLVGADVIVGFPGESDSAFQATCDLVAESAVNYLHVFPFSVRPGTEAAAMPDRISGAEIKRRGRTLRDLGLSKWTAFKESFIGRTQKTLAMRKNPDGTFEGLTRNYLPVRMRGDFTAGREYEVTMRALIGNGMKSRLLGD